MRTPERAAEASLGVADAAADKVARSSALLRKLLDGVGSAATSQMSFLDSSGANGGDANGGPGSSSSEGAAPVGDLRASLEGGGGAAPIQ